MYRSIMGILFRQLPNMLSGGLLLLGVLSRSLAHRSGESVWRAVLEHWFIAAVVVGATYALGLWISRTFG